MLHSNGIHFSNVCVCVCLHWASKLTPLLSYQFHGWMQTRALVWSRTNSIFFLLSQDMILIWKTMNGMTLKLNRIIVFFAPIAMTRIAPLSVYAIVRNPLATHVRVVRSWSRTRLQNEQNVKCCGFGVHAKPRYDGSSNSFYYASIFQMLFFLPLLSLTIIFIRSFTCSLSHTLSLFLCLSVALKRKSLCNYRRCHNRRCYLY